MRNIRSVIYGVNGRSLILKLKLVLQEKSSGDGALFLPENSLNSRLIKNISSESHCGRYAEFADVPFKVENSAKQNSFLH